MKSYGLQMNGEFFIDIVESKPTWTESYIGRFIYVEDSDTYWLGGVTKWLMIGYGKNAVDEFSLNTGFGYRQINSTSIPFKHSHVTGDNIFEAILSVSSGVGLYDSSIETRHLKNNQIKASHINWSVSDGFVNASYIPINSLFQDSSASEILSVEDAINQLELNTIKISRAIIQSTAWVFAPAENLYRATVVALPITTFPILVQCYTDAGVMIIPDRIEMDEGTKRVHIWYGSTTTLNVVMVG